MRMRQSLAVLVAAASIGLFATNLVFSQAGGAGAAGAGAAGNPALGGAAGGVGGLGGTGGVGGSSIGGGGVSGGMGGIGGGGLGGTFGAHQGNILTGPGATGIPQNYFRGAAPGMGLSPQEAPSGAPNSPLAPRLGPSRSRSIGGRRTPALGNGGVGRGVGPTPKGGDENPAETLLDEMNGSNNGHRTGHAALRPPRRYQRGPGGLSSDPPSIAPKRIEERAVYFAQRGAYEDSVYRPYQGSYRQPSRAATVARNRRRAY